MQSKSIAVIALTIFMTSAASAQDKPANPPAFIPAFGDFMLSAQARHAKLWLAGTAQNWDLAEYLIDELKEGMEDAARYVPMLKDVPVGQMIGSTLDAPIAEMEKVIKAKDRARFFATFDTLTEACNSCHQAANRPFIVVQRPATSSYPNQSFAPPRR